MAKTGNSRATRYKTRNAAKDGASGPQPPGAARRSLRRRSDDSDEDDEQDDKNAEPGIDELKPAAPASGSRRSLAVVVPSRPSWSRSKSAAGTNILFGTMNPAPDVPPRVEDHIAPPHIEGSDSSDDGLTLEDILSNMQDLVEDEDDDDDEGDDGDGGKDSQEEEEGQGSDEDGDQQNATADPTVVRNLGTHHLEKPQQPARQPKNKSSAQKRSAALMQEQPKTRRDGLKEKLERLHQSVRVQADELAKEFKLGKGEVQRVIASATKHKVYHEFNAKVWRRCQQHNEGERAVGSIAAKYSYSSREGEGRTD